ncbi:hypothetical protein HDU76_004950 [Blyttiomyces sp. JEL0837]|nr:hypothetical protein HDU76_004950 [Blyttiomyces sp. JEL0837]
MFQYNIETCQMLGWFCLALHHRPSASRSFNITRLKSNGKQTANRGDRHHLFQPCRYPVPIPNNRLAHEEIKTKATDIWNEAFDQDWQGDLELLPQDGIPTIFNGLGKVKSRSMYNRLCSLRPDLARISDELKVLIHNNRWYGGFNPHDCRPIIMLEDEDKIPAKKDIHKSPFVHFDILKVIRREKAVSCLLQIAMRQCWMGDLTCFVQTSPMGLGIAAIIFGHIDLVRKLITMNVFDLEMMSFEDDNVCMKAIGFTGNLEMLKLLDGRRNRFDCQALSGLVEKALKAGHIHMLRYLHEDMVIHDGDFSWVVSVPQYSTESLECWEWNVDICRRNNLQSNTVPILKNLAQAHQVVAKLGPNAVTFPILFYAALTTNIEIFDCVWDNRTVSTFDHLVFLEPEEIAEGTKDRRSALHFLINLHRFNRNSIIAIGLDAIKFLFTYNRSNSDLNYFFTNAIWSGNVEVVKCFFENGGFMIQQNPLELALGHGQIKVAEMLYERGWRISDGFGMDNIAITGKIEIAEFLHKHFSTAPYTSEAVVVAAENGYLEIVKFLHENGYVKEVELAMVEAATNADYDVVVYLFGIENVECNLEDVLVGAIESQSLRLVRFLLDNGVSSVSQDKKDQVAKDLPGFVNEEMVTLAKKVLSADCWQY